MRSSQRRSTGLSGHKSHGLKDSFGSPTTLAMSSWCTRLACGSSTPSRSPGMSRCLRTNGSTTKRSWKGLRSLLENIGRSLTGTKGSRLFSLAKIWTKNLSVKFWIAAWFLKAWCKNTRSLIGKSRIRLDANGTMRSNFSKITKCFWKTTMNGNKSKTKGWKVKTKKNNMFPWSNDCPVYYCQYSKNGSCSISRLSIYWLF